MAKEPSRALFRSDKTICEIKPFFQQTLRIQIHAAVETDRVLCDEPAEAGGVETVAVVVEICFWVVVPAGVQI